MPCAACLFRPSLNPLGAWLRAGIVVGTLGVAGYREAVEAVRALARRAGKRTYTLLVGKPSPAKLANFPEIEIFVLVADPQARRSQCCASSTGRSVISVVMFLLLATPSMHGSLSIDIIVSRVHPGHPSTLAPVGGQETLGRLAHA